VSARELREVALQLEQFRDVLATLNQATVRASDRTSVVVVVFRDGKSYRPFMPMVDGRTVPVGGMFVGGPAGTYITLNLEAGESAYRGIYHEYSHLILQSAFGRAPLWFNEGLAEYYSTLEVTSDGRRAIIGKAIEPHVALLRDRRLPMARLLAITGASPEYTSDTPARSVLYAQSWALVHHALHGQPRRREALINLAFKLAAGAKPEQAVLETYGLTMADLEREVQAYTRREIYGATAFDFKDAIVTSLAGAAVTRADESEVEAWLGSVQLTIGRIDEAEDRLEQVLKARPDLGIAHRAMAFVRMRQGRSADANRHLAAAAKANTPPQAAYQIQLTSRDARIGTEPSAAAAAPPEKPANAGTADLSPPPPRNGGLILDLRAVREGEQRILGTLQAIECGRNGVVVALRTAQGVTRAAAPSLAAIEFVTFRSPTGGNISCGTQTEAPALLTSRHDGTRIVAVALELLPDGYLP
jgi:hypothetical protein